DFAPRGYYTQFGKRPYQLLSKTELHVSPTHGLYTDPTFTLENTWTRPSQAHYVSEDYPGCKSVLAIIHDGEIIKYFIELVKKNQSFWLMDITVTKDLCIIKKQQQALNLGHTGMEGYNFHLMYLLTRGR
ncbi:MAG: hypothetical protein IPK96_22030, partial [Flammeovirgaceae bacterium]|nr:hypothetical protein [Flammeovirgaceae bacterium]